MIFQCFKKTSLFLLLIFSSSLFPSDYVTIYGKIKSLENTNVNIELLTKELIGGRRELFSNVDIENIGYQFINIEKKDLDKIKLSK